eukprot:COSAG04_NODE_1708_length_5862_cov_2.503384_4_plen_169_part_00
MAGARSFLEVSEAEDGSKRLTSKVGSGFGYGIGTFSCPSLGELRADPTIAAARGRGQGRVRLGVECGDVSAFHGEASNALATFQAASQFNCLEFVGPDVVPEEGVTGYAGDRTQGPACSIACGPATVFRNYFVQGEGLPEGQVGQTREHMIDNLDALNAAIGNGDNSE